MPSTVTLQKVVDLASTHAELMPLVNVGGYSNEPALSLCNDTLAELLGNPYSWKFNRTTTNILVTQYGRNDCRFAGASAWTQNGGVGIGLATDNAISESGTTVTVNTLDAHNFNVGDTVYMLGNTVAAYNSTFTQTSSSSQWSGGWTITATPTATSFQFVHASSGLAVSGAAGITDFGWAESATYVAMTDTSAPQFIRYALAVRSLLPYSRVGAYPDRVSMIQDEQNGILKFRIQPLPGSQPLGISIIYQKKAPVRTALDELWSPIPDEFAFLYRELFLAKCFRFVDSRRAEAEMQRAQQTILKAQAQDDAEESEEYVTPDRPLMGSPGSGGTWWL